MPNFTDLSVRNLPEGVHFDDRTPGFGIRIGKHRKTWLVVKQPNRTKVRLGHYPDLTLADARRRALVTLGSPLSPKSSPPFLEALESFLAQDRWKASTKKMLEWSLRRHFTWRKPVDKITHEDVAQVLDGISAPSERQHAFANIRIFFNWSIPRYLSASPTVGYEAPSPQSRARVLTDEELKAVWIAADAIGYPFGIIVKLLILTGQRRGEIAALQRQWISGEQLNLPSEITKNGRDHSIPIAATSVALLASIQLTANTNDGSQLLFPARDKMSKPFNGWSKSKANLDKLISSDLLKNGLEDWPSVHPWTLHDLRRTFATGLASLGVLIHVTEALLNHKSGKISGIAAIYNRYEYMKEMRQAMEQYEEWLLTVL